MRSIIHATLCDDDAFSILFLCRLCAASLQPAVPFLADVPWAYQESSEVIDALREGLLLRHSAWETRSADAVYRADKRSHPVFTIYAGPGSGKSRLLSELPRLALAAVRDNASLSRLLDPSLVYVFHVGFENGTAYQISEKDGAVAVANRMMWQLVRLEVALPDLLRATPTASTSS